MLNNRESKPFVNRIAFIGNYIPRKCGIATFTTDLAEAIANQYPETTCIALAVNDIPSGYEYLPRVKFELIEKDSLSYRRAGDYLNVNDVDVVNVQHEFGIFGGQAGSHILDLLQELRMPIVTTLHTVLKNPDPSQLRVMKEIGRLSSRLVVMSHRGVDYLKNIYKIPEEKIDFIHHGVPDMPFVDPNFYKDHFGVEGKVVLLTFGLLSANKGIENVIQALPAVLSRFPNLVYIVLGATHPNVLEEEGEAYRESLQELAIKLQVSDNVIFDPRFVTLEELIEYIGATDIYITPYLNPAQITSGTLAYTLGAGKAIISTPYWYAEELLADGRGVLVPFGNPQAIAEQVIQMLENEAERHAMRKRAYILGREMVWSKVAERYMQSFERARQEPIVRSIGGLVSKKIGEETEELPPLNLYHLSQMTDSTGILQHAVITLPNYKEGYTTDDNSRALVVSILLEEVGENWFTDADQFASRYLSFLWFAFNRPLARFRNFLGYDRRWLEEVGSEDSHGRAIWSLGTVCGHSSRDSLRSVASTLFGWALPSLLDFSSPRAWSFALIGIRDYLTRFSGDRMVQTIGRELADKLVQLYRANSSPDWHWFEDLVTYSNPRLSHALISTADWTGSREMLDIGLESLNWLANIQRSDAGHFSPIGSNGFYRRGQERASFDQQPVEASGMVSACLAAYRVTGDSYWLREAKRSMMWFLGENDLGLSLYDPITGGCRDGLHPDRANQNQGAESTLAFLMSLLEHRLVVEDEPANHGRMTSYTVVPVSQ